jgi:hypothetical protein
MKCWLIFTRPHHHVPQDLSSVYKTCKVVRNVPFIEHVPHVDPHRYRLYTIDWQDGRWIMTCLRYWTLLNTKCDVLDTGDAVRFVTLLYYFTRRHYNVLWLWRCVSERSWFLCSGPLMSFDLPVDLLLWSVRLSVEIYPVKWTFPGLLRLPTIRLLRNS